MCVCVVVRNAAYRENVAREIQKTEIDYLDNLLILIKVPSPSCH